MQKGPLFCPGAVITKLGQIVLITCLLPVIFGTILNRVEVLIQGVGIQRISFASPSINIAFVQYLK